MDVTVDFIRIDTQSVENLVQHIFEKRKTACNQALAELIDPWTPYDTGALSQNYTVDKEGIHYNVPYANYQYYGDDMNWNRNITHHPLATSHWDEVALPSVIDDYQVICQYILSKDTKYGDL